MREATKSRLSLAASCLLAGFGIGALLQRETGLPFATNSTAVQAPADQAVPDREFWRPEQVGDVRGGSYVVEDPIAGFVHGARVAEHRDWAEHPAGGFTMRTNNIGLRADRDTAIEPAAGTFRVLLTGDSHTDGLLDNAEGIASRTEAHLAAVAGLAPVEVLNAGVCFYGPHNYRGAIEKFLLLRPHAVAIVFYMGNDFLNAAMTALVRGEIEAKPRPRDYYQRLKPVSNTGPVQQSINQAYYFKSRPELEQPVSDLAAEELLAIHRLARQRGIPLIVLTLPSMCIIDWRREQIYDREKARLFHQLDLVDADLDCTRRMTDRLLERLRAERVRCRDLTPVFEAAPTGMYWRYDYHLNVAGSDLVARELARALEPLVPRR